MTSPIEEMKTFGLDANQLSSDQKAKKPSAKFRSHMDAQVTSRIESDKKSETEKPKHGLSRYMAKFRGAGVAVCTLLIVAGFAAYLLSISQKNFTIMYSPVVKTAPVKFESKIAAQIAQKKTLAQRKPTLLSYAPRTQPVRFKRKVSIKKS